MPTMPIFSIISLLLIPTLVPIEAVYYQVKNKGTSTPGGTRFDNEIGIPWSAHTLKHASNFIWRIFHQQNSDDRAKVDNITMIVQDSEYIAYEENNQIHVDTKYIANYVGDVKVEIKGVLYHETTHIWQWNGNGTAPSGLIEGVADYVRLKSGLAPPHWRKRGMGVNWDDGYDITAHFLEYCNGLRDGFVAELNGKMKYSYSEDYFVHLLGKNVNDLWMNYKARYNTNS
ncbi:hypothetical protein ACET3Z_022092 [Daucus carota]